MWALPFLAEQGRIVVREQIGRTFVNLGRSLKLVSGPAAGEKPDRAYSCFRRGLDVVRGIADHHQMLRRCAALFNRCLDDVRIRLRALRIAAGCLLFHQVIDARSLQQSLELIVLRRSRDDCFEPILLHAEDELARTGQRMQSREIFAPKDFAATFDELLTLVAVAADADRFRKQFVAAHSDQRSYLIERHVVASFNEGVHPRLRVSVVAVYKRAVDVENYAFEQQPISGSSGSIPLYRDVPGPPALLSGSDS